MNNFKVNNIDSITHLDNIEIPKMSNHEERVKKATEEVLKNKAVYNALKRLADE